MNKIIKSEKVADITIKLAALSVAFGLILSPTKVLAEDEILDEVTEEVYQKYIKVIKERQ